MTRRLSAGMTTLAVGEGSATSFEWPDTPLARSLRADDAEAARRLAGVKGRPYRGRQPREIVNAKAAAYQKRYWADRRAKGWVWCNHCKTMRQHRTADCPLR